jgi:hypothetical protein
VCAEALIKSVVNVPSAKHHVTCETRRFRKKTHCATLLLVAGECFFGVLCTQQTSVNKTKANRQRLLTYLVENALKTIVEHAIVSLQNKTKKTESK